MAIPLENKGNVEAPNVTYPFGNIRDDSGANDGTPVNTDVYGDFHQFFAKLSSEAGINLNGLPDNEVNGFQYFEALNKFNNERQVAERGSFEYDSDFFDVDILDVSSLDKRITASENNVYAQAIDSGNIKIFQISKSNGLEIGSITVGGNPEYPGTSVDLFFDNSSGFLYVLYQNGANPGFLVYDENLVFQPLLSVTNTGEVFDAKSISVTGVSIYLCGNDGANGSYLEYEKATLSKIVRTTSSTILYREIYANKQATCAVIMGSDGIDLIADVWLRGVLISSVNTTPTNDFRIIYFDRFSNKFYTKGDEAESSFGKMVKCLSSYPPGVSDITVDIMDSFDYHRGAGGTFDISDLVFDKNEMYNVGKNGQIRKYIRSI